jgi:protein SCO1/2
VSARRVLLVAGAAVLTAALALLASIAASIPAFTARVAGHPATLSSIAGGPAPPWPVPPFAFADADGRIIHESTLRGHVWIADFMFVGCTTMCPILTARMNLLRRAIPEEDVRFVSFSIDPEADTPDVLKEYARLWGGDRRWLLLRPSSAEVDAFARAMQVPFERSTDPREPILHTSLFFLVDRAGDVRGIYGGLDDVAVDRLASDALRLEASTGSRATRADADADADVGSASTGLARGLALYRSLGCGGCHSKATIAPSLAGLVGGSVRLVDGATLTADDSYVRESILDSEAKWVAGYGTVMPSYRGRLSDSEVDDLLVYLRSLGRTADAGAMWPPRP